MSLDYLFMSLDYLNKMALFKDRLKRLKQEEEKVLDKMDELKQEYIKKNSKFQLKDIVKVKINTFDTCIYKKGYIKEITVNTEGEFRYVVGKLTKENKIAKVGIIQYYISNSCLEKISSELPIVSSTTMGF